MRPGQFAETSLTDETLFLDVFPIRSRLAARPADPAFLSRDEPWPVSFSEMTFRAPRRSETVAPAISRPPDVKVSLPLQPEPRVHSNPTAERPATTDRARGPLPISLSPDGACRQSREPMTTVAGSGPPM